MSESETNNLSAGKLCFCSFVITKLKVSFFKFNFLFYWWLLRVFYKQVRQSGEQSKIVMERELKCKTLLFCWGQTLLRSLHCDFSQLCVRWNQSFPCGSFDCGKLDVLLLWSNFILGLTVNNWTGSYLTTLTTAMAVLSNQWCVFHRIQPFPNKENSEAALGSALFPHPPSPAPSRLRSWNQTFQAKLLFLLP